MGGQMARLLHHTGVSKTWQGTVYLLFIYNIYLYNMYVLGIYKSIQKGDCLT